MLHTMNLDEISFKEREEKREEILASDTEFITPLNQKLENGTWKSTCPYCGQEFFADTKDQVRNQEGIHRTENHIKSQKKDSLDRDKDMVNADNIVDQWKNGEKVNA